MSDCEHWFGRLGGKCLRCGKTFRELAGVDSDGSEEVAVILEQAGKKVREQRRDDADFTLSNRR